MIKIYHIQEEKQMKYHDFDSMPLVINVDDLADTLGIGKNKAYELINS